MASARACLCLSAPVHAQPPPRIIPYLCRPRPSMCVLYHIHACSRVHTRARTRLISLRDGEAAAGRRRAAVGPPFHLNGYLRSPALCQARGRRVRSRKTRPSPMSPTVGEAATQREGPCGGVQGSEGARPQRGRTGGAHLGQAGERRQGLRGARWLPPGTRKEPQWQSGGGVGGRARVAATGVGAFSQVRQRLEGQAQGVWLSSLNGFGQGAT